MELAQGDVLEPISLEKAARGCGLRFISFIPWWRLPARTQADRLGAQNMVRAAAVAGLEPSYLPGGLGKPGDPNLSEHLRSRTEVARDSQVRPDPHHLFAGCHDTWGWQRLL